MRRGSLASFLLVLLTFGGARSEPDGRPTGLPPGIDLGQLLTTFNDTNAAPTLSVLLTFTVRFLDGPVVPLATAQLISPKTVEVNETLGDGSCSFWIDPSCTYTLFLMAQGSKTARGPIPLRRSILIGPSSNVTASGVLNLGDVLIEFSSFCSGAQTITGNNGGVIAGGNSVQTLQIPNQTCTWYIGPFTNPGTIVLSLLGIDLSFGDSLTIYSVDNQGNQRAVLQLGSGYPNPGTTTVPSLSIFDTQATIVFSAGPGADSLTSGFTISYRVDRFLTTGHVLALSLIWAGGGFAFLLIVFLIFSLLQRRQRRIRAGQAPPLLPWEHQRVAASAEPDPLDHDVMVVKVPGEEPHRMALPQKLWQPGSLKSADEAPASDLAGAHSDVGSDNGPAPATGTSKETSGTLELSVVAAEGGASTASALVSAAAPTRQLFRKKDTRLPTDGGSDGQSGPTLSESIAGPGGASGPSSGSGPGEQITAPPITEKKTFIEKLSRVVVGKSAKQAQSSDAQAEASDAQAKSSDAAELSAPAAEGSWADSESCAICLVEYEEGAALRPLPCGHAFHTACIDTWLKKDPSCPLCKRPLYKPPLRFKPTAAGGRYISGLESGLGQPSAEAPSSTGADDGYTSAGTDLEAGPSTVARDGLASGLANEGLANEARERPVRDEREHRRHAINPAWFLHQWMGRSR